MLLVLLRTELMEGDVVLSPPPNHTPLTLTMPKQLVTAVTAQTTHSAHLTVHQARQPDAVVPVTAAAARERKGHKRAVSLADAAVTGTIASG